MFAACNKEGNVDRNSRMSTITRVGSEFTSRWPPAARVLMVLMILSLVPVAERRSSKIGSSIDCEGMIGNIGVKKYETAAYPTLLDQGFERLFFTPLSCQELMFFTA
jgi:hypothetical protein